MSWSPRRRSLVLALPVALAAACADPASVRVEVAVEERGLDALVLRVVAGRASSGEPTIACTFPAGAPAEKGCALEGGTGRWAGGVEPLSFVLYGAPNTVARVEVEAERSDGAALRVVSSTVASLRLPDQGGEAEEVALRLRARTHVQTACAPLTLSSEAADAQNDRSGVVLGRRGADGTRELVASAGGWLSLVDWRSTGSACGLVERLSLSLGNCRIWDGSLVAWREEAGEASIIAALCSNNLAPMETRLVALVGELDASSRAVVTTLSGVARTDVSRPVLADLDGDGRLEVYALAAKGGLSLVRWDPRASTSAPAELVLTGLGPYRGGAVNGPLVVRSSATGGRDVLVIAGYPGGVGVVAGAPPVFTWVHPELRTLIPELGSAALLEEHGPAAEITVATPYAGTGMRFTSIEVRSTTEGVASFTETRTFDVPAPPGFATRADPNVRVALGDLAGAGERTAVVVLDGEALLFPVKEGGVAVQRRTWQGSPVQAVEGVSSALLVDVDGRPGAELLSFIPSSPLVSGIDASGAALPGWPVFGPQGGALRVLVGELDAPSTSDGLRDLEVVMLSRRTLQVMKLGPGTYDPQAAPWPSVFRDARGSATLGPGERDPHAAGGE